MRTYGDPQNPPILFLHGIRLAGTIWDAHARALSDEFFVVTPDLPGHGALADLPFEIAVYDPYLAYIADHVTLRPPVVVGYSLGGYVAMRYATDLPDHTAGLLICGCSADITGIRALLYEAAVAFGAQLSATGLQNVLSFFFRLTLPRRVADTVIPLRFNKRVFETSRKTAVGVRYSDRLRRYGKPVAIVNGEFDPIFRADEQIYARAGNAEVSIIKGGDHAAPLCRPHEFSEIVRQFARKVYGGT
ncbi:MAG TPA: alpha/beta fold hydrolase [Candidatus Baltobacteraceae bacterium]|nr:alpha/beta fold hydrolase [Candidatus Baltobacteraceae bacterium]